MNIFHYYLKFNMFSELPQHFEHATSIFLYQMLTSLLEMLNMTGRNVESKIENVDYINLKF